MDKTYQVHVVIDPNYGDAIRDLPIGEPAWIVDSPDNHPVIVSIMHECTSSDYLTGISSFKYDTQTQPEDRLIGILSTVDVHHGEYSHDPPYSILNIIGVEWSQKIQKELSKFGFTDHEATPNGFITKRVLDDAIEFHGRFGPVEPYKS